MEIFINYLIKLIKHIFINISTDLKTRKLSLYIGWTQIFKNTMIQ